MRSLLIGCATGQRPNVGVRFWSTGQKQVGKHCGKPLFRCPWNRHRVEVSVNAKLLHDLALLHESALPYLASTAVDHLLDFDQVRPISPLL